jgi:hypothetical protein
MVTDGEPTAHLVGEYAEFSWPPVPETIRLTLAEAVRLARSGVTLNVFMLEDSPGLIRFMERLARLTSGRIFLMRTRRSETSSCATTSTDAPRDGVAAREQHVRRLTVVGGTVLAMVAAAGVGAFIAAHSAERDAPSVELRKAPPRAVEERRTRRGSDGTA